VGKEGQRIQYLSATGHSLRQRCVVRGEGVREEVGRRGMNRGKKKKEKGSGNIVRVSICRGKKIRGGGAK
jgi:hypothetical protein